MPAIHDAERVLDQAVFLARLARELGVPVMGTEQNPQALGGNEPRLRALCDRTLSKVHFSAVADGLLPGLREIAPEAQQLVLAGCETHVCLLQTCVSQPANTSCWASGAISRRPGSKPSATALK